MNNYWYILWFGFGMIFEAALFIWRDYRPHNASRYLISLLNEASKRGMGNKTIDELLRDAELVDLDIWIKRKT